MRPTGRLCDELLRWIVLEIQIMREEYDRPNNAPSTIHPPSQNPFKTKTSTCWSPHTSQFSLFLAFLNLKSPFQHTVMARTVCPSWLAQRKRVGLITQRSEDRNLDQLTFLVVFGFVSSSLLRYYFYLTFYLCCFYILWYLSTYIHVLLMHISLLVSLIEGDSSLDLGWSLNEHEEP